VSDGEGHGPCAAEHRHGEDGTPICGEDEDGKECGRIHEPEDPSLATASSVVHVADDLRKHRAGILGGGWNGRRVRLPT